MLLDVRSPELFARGHIPGALNLPHRKITWSKLREYPADTLFVTCCDGLALQWLDEGFALETQAASAWSEMEQEP